MSAQSGPGSRRRQTDADFVLDTRSLGRAPGSIRQVHRVVTASEKIGLDLIAIPAGAEIDLDLTLQAVSEGVLVTGSVSAPIEGECSRCLESFTDDLELEITELFAYPDSATEQTTEEDEIYRLVDDMIDIEPVVTDAVGLELPLQPLCEPDCAGLCPECGVRMAIAGPDHTHEILDPRWAGLAKFAGETPGTGVSDAPSDVDRSLADRNGSASSTTEEK
ncbi:YceD family protein [Nocardia aobensis]|uniref:YceD family protein n=1 Tax=Nocardia aobensis TaxID=257277 RepID=A0ABW6NY95_9NOCA